MVLHDSYMAKDFYCVASYAIHTFANMRSKCNRENKEGQNDIGTLLCLYSFDWMDKGTIVDYPSFHSLMHDAMWTNGMKELKEWCVCMCV